MDEARGTCEIAVETSATVETGRDETSRAEPCGRYPGKTPRDDKTTGMRSDLMRRVDTVFLLSFVGRGTAFSNLAELRTVISDLFSNSILS